MYLIRKEDGFVTISEKEAKKINKENQKYLRMAKKGDMDQLNKVVFVINDDRIKL